MKLSLPRGVRCAEAPSERAGDSPPPGPNRRVVTVDPRVTGPKIEQGGARGPTFASSGRDEPLRGSPWPYSECASSVTLEAGGTGARASLDVLDNLVLVPPNRTGPDPDRPGEPTRLHSFVDGRARKPGHRLHRTPLQQSHAYLLVARRAIRRVYRVAVAARDESPVKPLKHGKNQRPWGVRSKIAERRSGCCTRVRHQ